MSHKDFEKAAAKHRARQEKKRAADAPTVLSERTLRRRAKSQQVGSLSGGGLTSGVPDFFAIAFALVLPSTALFLLVPNVGELTVAFGGVGCTMTLIALYIICKDRLVAALRRGKVRRIGFGFDSDAYLSRMAEQRYKPVVEYKITFSEAWPEDLRATTGLAIRGWVPAIAAVGWSYDGKRMTAASAELDGRPSTNAYGGYTIFSNYRVHESFIAMTAKALPKLNRSVSISQLEVEITGETTPYTVSRSSRYGR
jgi:hypothetical protein